MHEREDKVLSYSFYLLQVMPSTFDGGDSLDDCPQAYLRPGHMVQLDPFICTHGPGARLHGKLT